VEGWVLDVYAGVDGISLWLRQRGGGVVKAVVDWCPRLYLAGPADVLSDVERALAEFYCVRLVRKRLLGAGLVDALEVAVPAVDRGWLAGVVEESWGHLGVRAYNTDVPAAQEFLYNHGITPTQYIVLEDGKPRPVEEADTTHYDTSFLKTARLEAVIDRSGPFYRFSDRLKAVRVEAGGEAVVVDGEEGEVLLGLCRVLDELDVDVVVTEGGDGFLFTYLWHRALENMVELRLGREGGRRPKAGGHTYISYGRTYHRYNTARLRGRLHIDAWNSMLYGETGLDGVLEVARTCRIPVQDAARYTIGRCMTSLQYRQAYLNNVLIPRECGRPACMTAAELVVADRGGWILDHRPGVYWNVGELDFHSLYPMLMLEHNISGETVDCGCCSGVYIPELGYHVCRRWRGIVPQAIETPLNKRLAYKRLYNETGNPIFKARSNALKWILVTSFGYLGYRKAKFGSRKAHMAVCALARDTLLKSVRVAEELGFKVLHGIVDCLWVWRQDASEEDYRSLAVELEKRVGLPVGYEGTYRWVAFLTSKTQPGRPVNNRYFGVYTDGRLKYRGIELRRRDTPPLVRQMQSEMLEKLAEARDPAEAGQKAVECIGIFQRYLHMIYTASVGLEKLAVEKTLGSPLDAYTRPPKHVLAAKMMREAGVELHPGQTVQYVVKRCGAVPKQLLTDNGYSETYYEEYLRRAAETICAPFGVRVGK
jgi:DNA polymerase elongation subunit (family B)